MSMPRMQGDAGGPAVAMTEPDLCYLSLADLRILLRELRRDANPADAALVQRVTAEIARRRPPEDSDG